MINDWESKVVNGKVLASDILCEGGAVAVTVVAECLFPGLTAVAFFLSLGQAVKRVVLVCLNKRMGQSAEVNGLTGYILSSLRNREGSVHHIRISTPDAPAEDVACGRTQQNDKVVRQFFLIIKCIIQRNVRGAITANRASHFALLISDNESSVYLIRRRTVNPISGP